MLDPVPREVFEQQLALGRLCWSWATLDRELNRLLGCVLQNDEAQIACIATEIDAVAARSRLIKRLLPTLDMPGWWAPKLDKALSRIDSEIGPLRNRCIHDAWTFDEGQFIRTDRRAFVKKMQAHSPSTLLFDQKHTMTVSEIENLLRDMLMHLFFLVAAQRDIENKRETNVLDQPKSLLCIVESTWQDQQLENRALR